MIFSSVKVVDGVEVIQEFHIAPKETNSSNSNSLQSGSLSSPNLTCLNANGSPGAKLTKTTNNPAMEQYFVDKPSIEPPLPGLTTSYSGNVVFWLNIFCLVTYKFFFFSLFLVLANTFFGETSTNSRARAQTFSYLFLCLEFPHVIYFQDIMIGYQLSLYARGLLTIGTLSQDPRME